MIRAPGLARLFGRTYPLPGTGRVAAQQLARRELSKPMYHPPPSLMTRFLDWLNRLLGVRVTTGPGEWLVLAITAVLLVILVAAVLTWLRPAGRARRAGRLPTGQGAARTAAEYREHARRLAEMGDYSGAIPECLRAVAAELDERQVLPSRPGWTADEFADAAGRILPPLRASLRRASVLFDEVCYGEQPGTAKGYDLLREVDDLVRVSAASPRADGDLDPGAAGAAPSAGVPR